MAIIRNVEVPRPGMYVLDEDIALDVTKRRAVAANSPQARFVLGSAGVEISPAVIADVAGLDIKDQHVSLAKTQQPAEIETTGPVPSRAVAGPEGAPVTGGDSTHTEGEPISTAALDAGRGEPKTEKPAAKKTEDK